MDERTGFSEATQKLVLDEGPDKKYPLLITRRLWLMGLLSASTINARDKTKGGKRALKAAPAGSAWTWGKLHDGDCDQENGLLVFYADGKAKWSCRTRTLHTHSGDIWHCTFNVRDARSIFLFNLTYIDSPRMNDDAGWYNWNQDLTFPAQHFSNIAIVDQNYSC
jgi:hypothetical protein